MRMLVVCPECEGEGSGCPLCEGACTLCIPEAEVKETDTVINRDIPDAQTPK